MVVDHSALDDYFILERMGYILIWQCILFSVVCYLYVRSLAIYCSHGVVYCLDFVVLKELDVTPHVTQCTLLE